MRIKLGLQTFPLKVMYLSILGIDMAIPQGIAALLIIWCTGSDGGSNGHVCMQDRPGPLKVVYIQGVSAILRAEYGTSVSIGS